MTIQFSDEQSSKLQIGKYRSITFRFSCWCMQDFYVWDHALLRNQCQTRMLLVSYLFFMLDKYTTFEFLKLTFQIQWSQLPT